MRNNFTRASRYLAFLCACLFAHAVHGQTNHSFDVETTAADESVIQLVSLPGNKVGILKWINADDIVYTVFDANGIQTLHTNITSQINWPHATHDGVTFKATATADGKLFLAYAINTNSAGMVTYNALYTLLDENGVALTSGQLNTSPAAEYIFNLVLDRLSDGKIVAAWKYGNEVVYFRLFNPNGTAVAANQAVAGAGTSIPTNTIYDIRMAAGKGGNFMISVVSWDNPMRGFIFDNNGVNAISGGASSFSIDPSIINDYSNIGVAALSNENFVQSWYLQGTHYMAIFSKNGNVVRAKYPGGLVNPTHFFPVYNPGAEGYIQTEESFQTPGSMSDPNSRHTVHRFDNNGDLQSSSVLAEDYEIRPVYHFTPGIGSGYAYTYTFYKAYHVQSMGGMPGMNYYVLDGDRDSKGVTREFSMTTLSVVLASYTASLQGNGNVQLHWTTSAETSNSYFEIQKRQDGQLYRTIGQVKAAESHGASYQFTDEEATSGKVYYRLRQFDADGRMKDLGTRLVQTSGRNKPTAAYPNPVEGNTITIRAGNETLPCNWRLVDAAGRQVTSGFLRQAIESVNVSTLIPGIYYLYVGQNKVIKLVK